MDASVIIATYNRKDLLATCLRCLDAQDHPPRIKEVSWDDGSTDGSVEMVKDWPARIICDVSPPVIRDRVRP